MENIKQLIKDADSIIIGAGSGLSTAAGVSMNGKDFEKEFAPWIKKYHFTDLYTSSFYNFKTSEEKWAYWGKYIKFIDIDRKEANLYKDLYELVKDKNYFVVTTNVDDQFYKGSFDKDKIFRVQGSYRLLQCSTPCHNKLYDAESLCNRLVNSITPNLTVPSTLVPKCPVCGEEMEVNLRKDDTFVQDDLWYEQSDKYDKFLEDNKNKKTVMLELGVGFNTPGIIRLPFESLLMENPSWYLIRLNENITPYFKIDSNRFIGLNNDISTSISKLK